MKTKKSLIMAACAAVVLSSVPFSAGAAETDYVYGTMEIPYADFYKAELAGSANAYDVDAVSSATASKWAMNEEGKLCEGTFNKANENGEGGQILGVTYPVAVKADDLKAMGNNNFNFTKTDETPAVYKVASVENGSVVFSEVKDSTPEKLTGEVTFTANTAWGDYLIDVKDKPEDMGAIYGAVIKTTDNKSYGMRHLENIWRGELAWSSGVKKTEPHGNALSYENFQDIMGATISEVTYITKNGYYTAETSLYVPVKFEGAVTAENAAVTSGKTTVKTEGFPADYNAEYSVEGLDAKVSRNTMTFKNGTPGNYTLTVKDKSGKYADLSASFTLTTDKMPAAYKDGKVVKAEGASDADFENFMKNLSKIAVGEKTYSASGRGAVKIIGEDGTIDMEASSRDVKVFDGSDTYSVSVSANGYEKTLDFVIKTAAEEVTTTAQSEVTTGAVTTTSAIQTTSAGGTTAATTAAKPAVTTTKPANVTSSPKTGDTSSALIPALALTAAGALAVAAGKRKNK